MTRWAHWTAVGRELISVNGLVGLSLLLMVSGCARLDRTVELPSRDQFEREQLRISSDFRLPRKHRLLDELVARRLDISERLLLPISDEPIHVYLFRDEDRFQKYLSQNFPLFPNRRAFFIKNDTDLKVFAHWGEHVGDDLRHELTHGYLHSVVSNIPLWLDEGLAEFFEQPRGVDPVHHAHVYHLTRAAKQRDWQPDLSHLESLTNPATMTQLEYAEAWLWVHFLLEGNHESMDGPRMLKDQLARIRMTGNSEPLSAQLEKADPEYQARLNDHFVTLANQINSRHQVN